MLLKNIESPKDLKKLSISELTSLCKEMREVLIKKLSKKGGHAASNLGIVELTAALHYVFSSPKDKIIFDTSHQTYIHKMLTGRSEAFLDEEKYDSITGFSNSCESEHDIFTLGHTSSSISLAAGLSKARDLKGEKYNVIAVIGDGSLSGGLAFEGLNNVSEQNTNTIIIVNDNDMSIAENHGGLYSHLKMLRQQGGKSENNIFISLGYDYYFLKDGNDITKIISLLQKVKDTPHPTLLHIVTQKGKGLTFAENDKETWHSATSFDITTGKQKARANNEYNKLTGEYLLKKITENQNIVIVIAGTPSVLAFDKQKRLMAKDNFIDVGIAESHAVSFSAGLAKNGAKPVVAIYSSFIQRAYDQLSQDIGINKSPAVFLIAGGSVFGSNDVSHCGLYDIPMISNIPNILYLAPTSYEEYLSMLDWAICDSTYPVAIKMPGGDVISATATPKDYSIIKSEVIHSGSQVAIMGLGTFFTLGKKVCETLKKYNINATLVNPIFISHLDTDLLDSLPKNHQIVVTIEDGIIAGGWGQKVASFLGSTDIKVLTYGIKKGFYDKFDANTLLKNNGITEQNIVKDILNLINI